MCITDIFVNLLLIILIIRTSIYKNCNINTKKSVIRVNNLTKMNEI